MEGERQIFYAIFEVEPGTESLSWNVDFIGIADEKQHAEFEMYRTHYRTNYLGSNIEGADVTEIYDRKNNKDILISFFHYYSDTYEDCVLRMLKMREEYSTKDIRIRLDIHELDYRYLKSEES